MEFYKETKFKVMPIGKLPEGWECVKIEDICDMKRGFSYSSNQISKNTRTDIELITINNFSKDGGLKADAEKLCLLGGTEIEDIYYVNKGDLFIANTDMSKGLIIGAPILWNVADRRYIYSMDLTKVIVDKTKITNEFFYYVLGQPKMRKLMITYAQGTNVLHLNHNLVREIKVFLPSLLEQKALILIFSKVDEIIQKTSEIIQKTELLKKGLMQKLLTRGIRHKEYKYSEELECEIPEEWDVVNIEYVAKDKKNSIKRGPWGGSLKKEIFIKSGYKVYEQQNVINKDFSLGNYYISEEKYNELKDFSIEEGDILLTSAGSIGNITIVPKNFELGIINQALFKISLNEDKMIISFFRYIFGYENFVLKILQSSHGATIKNISNTKELKSIKIPLPPLTEQKQIASILAKVDNKIEKERQTKEQLERLKKSLMQLLLTGKIRVKVN